MPKRALANWARDIIARYESGAAGEFILHGNTADTLMIPPSGDHPDARSGRLIDYLSEVLLPRFAIVLAYDPGAGLHVLRGREEFAQWPRMRENPSMPGQPLDAARLISHFLAYVRNLRALGHRAPTTAVILRDAMLYLPHVPQATGHELAALASLVRSWATDVTLAGEGQAVFVLCERLSDLHPLVARNPRACPIEIPLPDAPQLENAMDHLATKLPNVLAHYAGNFAKPATRLAGTSLAALEAALRLAEFRGERLVDAGLGELRKSLVERDARDLIEFVEPTRSLDAVIGLDAVKNWLRQDISLWRQDDLAALPMGYLFCGPVGTGKTYLAECLAGEAGVPVVKLRNFRERWVGSTEANLETIFTLIHALGRAIVFIDEADQALGRRQTSSGDSGVSSRVYSMIAAEMSDPSNRGRILWVLATSRPDLIEVDLKRPGRIDVKIPIFPATEPTEAWQLLRGLCVRRKVALVDADELALRPLLPPLLTAGAAEAIAVRAYRMLRTRALAPAAALAAALENYQAPVDPAVIRAQMALAAEESTDAAFIPEPLRGKFVRRADST